MSVTSRALSQTRDLKDAASQGLSGKVDKQLRKSSFDLQALLACARGELFGPGNAQLPLPPMLMFDRITHISDVGGLFNKGEVKAEFEIKPDLWFFNCHFKGDPVMPGCLGLDAMWQLVGFFLGWLGGLGRGRALGVGEVKLRAVGTNLGTSPLRREGPAGLPAPTGGTNRAHG